jgi:hypothetical protein
MRLEEGRLNARMGRWRQLAAPMQKLTHKCESDIRKKKNMRKGFFILPTHMVYDFKQCVIMHNREFLNLPDHHHHHSVGLIHHPNIFFEPQFFGT